jgi:hypothetical protein
LNHSSRQSTLAGLVEQLVEMPDRNRRARLLLETIQVGGWAQAVALFQPAMQKGSTAWMQLLARGPADLLPAPELVEAIEKGEFPPELPLKGHVLFAGEREGRTALALGSVTEEEQTVAELEALLEVWVALDIQEEEESNALDRPLGPIPGETEADGDTDRENGE